MTEDALLEETPDVEICKGVMTLPINKKRKRDFYNNELTIKMTPTQIKEYSKTKKRAHNKFTVKIGFDTLENMLKTANIVNTKFEFDVIIIDDNKEMNEPVLTIKKDGIYSNEMPIKMDPTQVIEYSKTSKRSHNKFTIKFHLDILEKMLEIANEIACKCNYLVTVVDENDGFSEPVLIVKKEGLFGFIY